MAAGSRKRRRANGRLASPPLGPSPLLTRNLQLLPVGLTRLPSDVHFVSQLRNDIGELLSAFAEALLLFVVQSDGSTGSRQDNGRQEDRPVASAFSIFASLWRRKGWHYAQFAFGDHTDSKQAFGEAICRALLEHLSPHVDRRNGLMAQGQNGEDAVTFTDLRQLFQAYAVPLALYLFWSTQIYCDSGTGVKHCRPAMERIAIEQDYYDWLLELPQAVLKHLEAEPRTQRDAHIITADLVEVLCRLTGSTPDDDAGDGAAAAGSDGARGQGAKKRRTARKTSDESKRRRPEARKAESRSVYDRADTVFDIVSASRFYTRMPRTWPSVRVVSTLEANKEFGRLGQIVRIQLTSTNDAGSTDQVPTESSRSGVTDAERQDVSEEAREVVAGLSRGDVVRLKARQRLALASLDLSKLAEQTHSGESSSNTAMRQIDASELLAETAEGSGDGPSRQRARYEIQTPAWISSAKYTAKMKPWLEQASTPMQQSLERVASSSHKYAEARSRIMPSSQTHNADRAGEAEQASVDQDQPDVQTDFGQYVLQSFRAERQGRGSATAANEASQDATGGAESSASTAGVTVDDPGSLSLESLYRLAAERTKTEAVARGETLKSLRARTNRHP
ncbi:hypothetical protein PANT_13c00057 [Moesziomyces antarcticus T-34]|uniref:Uncharacterized protein n=1 Tax=Pseudozyma antarctica (strain T-34) TaxID=1151754 RepID=M9LWU8_PSEA3|nr:hypothetical protein PANT_13c00057 [Moesziomyces antarcticus T-34]